ncbi:hypothetical protein DID78_04290 [Candidatus Marinamargulisbacteria bacterium SCGC AG-343-D04]|nr:hypothetical protein DID78_04290 [Candidatus Marinamargulisbacteria bacterium SCGC AG-343-D04]
MFRFFDIIVLLITVVSFLFSLFLWFSGFREEGLYVGLWSTSIIGIGIYIKLLRIVHFVLYRNLHQPEKDH